MKKKQIWMGICIFEILLSGIAAFFVIKDIINNGIIDTSIKNWKSKYIEYSEGWYVDEEILQTDEPVVLIYGPGIDLPKGTYSIRIEYECDNNQMCKVNTRFGENVFVKAGTAILSKNKSEVEYNITLTDDVEIFSVEVQYDGKGMLGIKNIAISRNSMGSRKSFFMLLLVFIVLDVFLLFSKQIKKNKNLVIMLGGIAVLASLPLLSEGIGSGHDLGFHLLRIEAIADGIHFGEWSIPVRLSNLWIEGYGYPTSIFYGDLLLYIPAFTRLMGFSITEAYKIYVFLINAGTTVISYICFYKVFRNKNIAVLTSLAYVTATYRMVCVYVRAAVGEYSAMMFFPIIALAVFRIYAESNTEWKTYKRNIPLLAVGMSGVIETHIPSTEIVVFVLVLICIAFLKKTLTKNTLKVYFLSAIETILLNLFFIVPFIDYYINVPVNAFRNKIAMIQGEGAYITQLFSAFSSVRGISTKNISDRMSLTPGMVLMAIFLWAIILWINKKADKWVRFFTVFSGLMLIMATNLFPWNYLARHNGFGNMLAQIEFPWRYLGVAIIFLTLLLGSVMQLLFRENRKEYISSISKSIIAVCFIMSLWFMGSYYYDNTMNYYYDTADLNTNYSGIEYLRTGSDLNENTHEIATRNVEETILLSRNGKRMELYCSGVGQGGEVEVPVFNYKGYCVRDEFGTEYNIEDGMNNVIKFMLPPGFSGKVVIDFEEPWYWRMAELVSLISVLGLLFTKKINERKYNA